MTSSAAVTSLWNKAEQESLKGYLNKPSINKGIKSRKFEGREQKLSTIRSLNIDELQNAVIVKEGNWNKQQDVFGTAEEICNNARSKQELYYRNTKGGAPVRFFLDLDPVITVRDDRVEAVKIKWELFLQKFVDAASDVLGVSDDSHVFVDHGIRDKGARLIKLSAHIVWRDVIFPNTASLKTYFNESFMPQLIASSGFGTTAHLLECLGELQGREPNENEKKEWLCDKAVYNSTRLFRGPLQLKLGDKASLLKLGSTYPKRAVLRDDPNAPLSYVWNDRNPFCWGLEANFVVPQAPAPAPSAEVHAAPPSNPSTFGVVYEAHYKMIANFYWPAYMNARADWAKKTAASTELVTPEAINFVPPATLGITMHNGHAWTSTFEVPGDSFCLCDPRGYHRNNPDGKITFQINISSMAVKQLCWVCGADHSVTTALTITGAPLDHKRLKLERWKPQTVYRMISQTSGRALVKLFHAYMQDRIVYRPAQMDGGRNFYIYGNRDDFPIWTGDEEAIQNLLTYEMEEFIDALAEECSLVAESIKKHEASAEGDVSASECDDDEDMDFGESRVYKVLQEHGRNWRNNNPQAAFKLHFNTWAPSNTQVDVHDELVGLRNNMAFNVKTGELRRIQKSDMMTGTIFADVFVDANGRLDVAHPQCMEIHRWFKEIAAGRNDLALYLKRLCGYSFTRMVWDRKFYVLYGAGSDGKSTLGKFFQECLGHDRYFSVPASFFADGANAKTSAEGPTANAASFYGKTCAMTEDMSARSLDNAKIKSYSAGDRVSGRKLYSNTTSWKQSAKLWFATNVDPHFSSLDQAIIDRLVVIPMDTRWVRNPNYQLGEKMADPKYLETLLTYTDAFATVVLHAFSQFVITHQARGEQFFPIPPCVATRTEQYVMDNHPYKRYIKECIEEEKQLMPGGQCCLGVMSVFQAYNAFKKHVEAKGEKSEETEGNFRKTMKLYGFATCGYNDLYPYYHKTSARKYFPEFHCMRRHDEIMLGRDNQSSSSSAPAPKRHCAERISADADVY